MSDADPTETTAWASGPYSIKRHGVTITNCDSEPVQTPGCIQSHGALLALRPSDLTILQASENSARWLGKEPEALLGKSAEVVLGEALADKLRALLASEPIERNPLYAFTVQPAGREPLDATVHTNDGLALLEFEALGHDDRGNGLDHYTLVKTTVARLQAAGTVKAFCQVAAEEVRRITGLDRVMVYRFHADDSGEVFAEAKRDDLPSWYGLRYPAHDIPRPAREIFKRIWIRPVPDVTAPVQEMVPLVNPDTGKPLEMTYCALRGPSVMYTEYLQNMGVSAALTLSIVRDGALWGLIACHHYSTAKFPYQMRASAELMAQVVSLQLKSAEERESLEYRVRLDDVHQTLLSRAATEGGLATMVEPRPSLLDGIESGGVAIYHREKWWTAGKTPSEKALDALSQWLRASPHLFTEGRPVYATDALSSIYEPAEEYQDVASGVLAVPISREWRSFVFWFRPETVHTVHWGGNPHEMPKVTGPHGPRLTPRASFELWKETVHGRSLPWKAVEIEAALKLRLLVMDLVVSRAEELAALNANLARSNEELDAFAYVASHDLKEPLRGIHKYGHYLLEEAKTGQPLSPQGMARIESLLRLTVRMDGLLEALLHFSRVGRVDSEHHEASLEDVVREAVEMLGARVIESGADIRVPRPLPHIHCDRVRAREVVANLIDNALKYNTSEQKWVEIGYVGPGEAPPFDIRAPFPDAAAGSTVYYVRDNGIGIDPKHYGQVFRMFKRLHARDAYGGGSGAGLTIAKKIVEREGGILWVDSAVGKGSTFFFTLPVDRTLEGRPG
ncbi:ATP-binding protein [Polyangium aurulentum]|uniref:ATP-binding protein n=1 Tax=Polyangium aurulentum TaxID=2567896 RepID=UPI0010AEB441|nr:ATP-binding protein [Polyangium aurulentum]UQA62555.1 GAF domain-containing protein [Polyangium aurulentum]